MGNGMMREWKRGSRCGHEEPLKADEIMTQICGSTRVSELWEESTGGDL